MLANVGGYFGSSTYYSQRTKSNTGQSAVSFSSTASIHLHMNNPEGGDKAVTSVGFPDGTSASVYSAEGYSQYTVKYWNQNGNISKYNYDADEVDAGNANYLEMLAFTSHLDKTGQTSNAFGDFISAAQGVNGDRTYNSENILSRYDFKQMTEDFMNAQYRFGNMTGYLSVKNLYDHMMSGAFNPGTDSRKTVDDSDRRDDNLLLEKAQSGDTVAARKIIEKNIASGRIQKAMDGNEFIRMQGEIIQKNHDEAMKNWKSTRERLLEQDPGAESRWYTYGNDSKRYTFDEFCDFMDRMYAEQRANAPKYRNQFLEMANQSVSSDIDVTETPDISDKEMAEEQPFPGFGMALAGNMGYGMKASLVSTGSTDDVIVRVKLATGGGNYESVDVNLSEFNPRNATAVEMFAYCQYKDAMGEGSGHTWGSWSAIKKVISPGDGMNFGSLENIMNEKRNWTGALAKSKTYMENPKSGETLSAADLLKMFEEQNKLTAEELKEGDDWRNMSDDDWDKLLSGVDNYIDAYKEEIREKVKKQMEAARKAAMEADQEMRSTAAQEAALSVAASGFDAGDDSVGEEAAETMGEDPGIDHEKNWTKKLKTDDQTVLRTAKAAQAMESMALNRMEEMASNGISTYDSYVGMAARYLRDRRVKGYA